MQSGNIRDIIIKMEEEIINSSSIYIKEGNTDMFDSTITLVYDKSTKVKSSSKNDQVDNNKKEINLTDFYSDELLKLRNDSSFTGSSIQLQYLVDIVLK